MPYELKLFSGNAHRPLAEEIAQHLHVKVGDADVARFSDGEVYVQINENVRGEDVFIIQPTCPPVNENLVELLVMLDAFKRASARRITAVVPYYGYGRQDRKAQSRVPISAKLVADLITTAGASRVLADRPARRSDPGLLQYPGGPPLRGPGPDRLSRQERPGGSRPGLARTRAVSSGRAPSPSGSRRGWPSSTSAATAPTSRSSCT